MYDIHSGAHMSMMYDVWSCMIPCVNVELYSLTCQPHIYPLVFEPFCLLLINSTASLYFSLYLFPIPLRLHGWVGWRDWLHII